MANILDIECDIDILMKDIKSYIADNKKIEQASGEVCPRCKTLADFSIYNSRINSDDYRVRWKKCNICNHKWKTVEVLCGDNVREYAKGV